MNGIDGWERMSLAQRAREIKSLAEARLPADGSALVFALADIVEDLAMAVADRMERERNER